MQPPRFVSVAKVFLTHPWTHVSLAIVLSAAAQLWMKLGADAVINPISWVSWLGFQALGSGWTWLGIIAYIASFGSWLYALRFLPLGLAFNLTNIVYVLVPLASWWFLGEKLGVMRLVGIALILTGIIMLARSVAEIEEKL
jgi:multidrug transporter EmrE-like cation transporter